MGEIQPIHCSHAGRVASGKNVPENRNSGVKTNRCTSANCPLSSVSPAENAMQRQPERQPGEHARPAA